MLHAELAGNRKATYNYEILETFEAGIVLKGTEIKSLRDNGGNLQESFVQILDSEAWLIGCHIAPYRLGNIYNHEPTRKRKLLLHKRELATLQRATSEKGLSIVPLSLFLKGGFAKLRIAIGRGKKVHDKRQAIQEKEEKRAMARVKKQET